MADLSKLSDTELLQMRDQSQAGISSVSNQDLIQMRQQAIGQQEESILANIDRMGGRLPFSGPLPPPTITLPATGPNPPASGVNPEFEPEVQRREAMSVLTKQGFSPDQIQAVMDIQKQVNPGIIGQIKQNIGEEAGALAGGAAGAKLGLLAGQIPPFTALPEEALTVPLFSAAGAFLGGGAGKAAQQAIDPLESPSARDFLRAGATQAAFEGTGRLVGPALRGIGFGAKPAEAVEEAKKRFKLEDGFFTPAQRDRRVLVRTAEQLSRGSFGGAPIFEGYNLQQMGQAVETAQEIIKRVAGGELEDPKVLGSELAGIFTRLGEKGQQVKGARQTLLDPFFDDLYRQVDALSPGAQFTTAPLKKIAKEKLEQDIKQGGALLTSEGRKRLKGIIKTLEGTKSADDMRQLRSLYVKDSRRLQLSGDQSSVVFSELASAADDILFSPGSELGLTEPARRLLRNTNAVYGASKQLYDESVVKEIVKKLNVQPTLVNELLGKKPDPKRLKSLRELLVSPVRKTSGAGQAEQSIAREFKAARSSLKNPEAIRLLSKNTAEGKQMWRQVKAAWLSDQFESSLDRTTGLFNAKKFDNAIKGMNPESFRVMFPGDLGKDIKALSGLMDTISAKQGGLATLFGKGVEFSGAGAVTSGLSAGSGMRIGKGLSLILGPTAYAKIATNPKANKVLTLALKQQAKGKAVDSVALAARIINTLNKSELDEQNAIKRQDKAQSKTAKVLAAQERFETRRKQQQRGISRF